MNPLQYELAKKGIKIGVVVAGVVTLVVVGRKVVRYIKEKRVAREAEEAAQNAITNLKKAGISSTLTQQAVKSIADALLQAFDYTWGTDLTIVDNCLAQIQTAGDWYAVRKTFGIKPYGTTGTPWVGSGTMLDLIGWCRKELSGSRLERCEALDREVNSVNLSGLGYARLRRL